MNRHKRQLALLLPLLLGGCASLPPPPVPVATPTEVYLVQNTRKGGSHRLRLLNGTGFEAANRPRRRDTKVSPDPDLSRLLQGLAWLGYFEAALPRDVGGEKGQLAVVTPVRSWFLPRPTDANMAGRTKSQVLDAARRYQECMGLFLEFYNQTEYYVPVKNKEGRNLFYKEQRNLKRTNSRRKGGF